MKNLFVFVLSIISVISSVALAEPKSVRWTKLDTGENLSADIASIIHTVATKTGYALSSSEFTLIEDRPLANNRFRMYSQTAAGVPIKAMSVRVWSVAEGLSESIVQVEAQVEAPSQIKALRLQARKLGFSSMDIRSELETVGMDSAETMRLARSVVAQHDTDKLVRDIQWKDQWQGSELVRAVTVKGRRGKHQISISIGKRKVIESSYSEFPQFDSKTEEFAVPAMVYPVYEEVEDEGTILTRIPAELKYLKARVHQANGDTYAPLRTQRYLESKYDPLLGETEAGRAEGYWAMSWIKREALRLHNALPMVSNLYDTGDGVLEGRYASISLHPAAAEKFHGILFPLRASSQFLPLWQPTSDDSWEMIPTSTLLGKPVLSADELASRPARRLANHDPVAYINDGFDEIQVYYAINQLFDSLRPMGFTDPDLSTRPFHAFMFDPDISMQDNAYYTDDTINFTTYSPKAINFARDNSTIWHELGHGVMDRLMGDQIRLADTGGLSEGMADFVAALVIADVMGEQPFPGSKKFRIINKTGFLLTNEVHDDGEAYGGAMHDLMEAAIARWGKAGLKKVTDLTLESMRLSRNHPGLTAEGWFSHMLFADALGAAGVREPGELSELIIAALAGRNYPMAGKSIATFKVMNGESDIAGNAPGTRNNPIKLTMAAQETKTYNLKVSVQDGEAYQFAYPLTVKVFFTKGALQGAVHWEGEEVEPREFTIAGPGQSVEIPLTVRGTCDAVNQEDGSCKDYAYVQIWNHGESEKPQAKKRFYLRVKTAAPGEGS